MDGEQVGLGLGVSVEVMDVQGAYGLDGGNDPISRALKRLDPDSHWVVGPKDVCRYPKSGGPGTAYDLPEEAVQFLHEWTMWYVKTVTSKEKAGPVPQSEVMFEMAPAEYPEELLVEDYLRKRELYGPKPKSAVPV